MKKIIVAILQITTVLLGLLVLAGLLVEPHFEGRNVDASFWEVYFHDAFLAYVYIGSIPFFVALYKFFQVLGFSAHDKLASPESIKNLQVIRNCALITVAAVFAADVFLIVNSRTTGDDSTGAVALGMIVIFLSLVAVGVISVFKRRLQSK